MIHPITLLGVAASFAVLYFRYRSQPKDRRRSSLRQKYKLGKILLMALLAWLTLIFNLHHMIWKMDGADREPSLMERVVSFLSK
jgi:hypothetical protein